MPVVTKVVKYTERKNSETILNLADRRLRNELTDGSEIRRKETWSAVFKRSEIMWVVVPFGSADKKYFFAVYANVR